MSTRASIEQVLAAAVEAFNARDVDGFLATMTPDVEAHSSPGTTSGWTWTWRSRGDHGVAMMSLVGRGKASGVELDMRLGKAFRVRDGLCSYFRIYDDRDEARRAAGLE